MRYMFIALSAALILACGSGGNIYGYPGDAEIREQAATLSCQEMEDWLAAHEIVKSPEDLPRT